MPAAAWEDRFVERVAVDPRTLTPHPLNWRSHPEPQMAALRGSLDELGWVDEIKVNRQSGRIFNGHARVELAAAAGVATVPVAYYDLSDAEERAALAAFDPITALAGEIAEKRAALLAQVIPETKSAQLRGLLAKQQAAAQAALNAAAVRGLAPSRRQYPLDLIFTLAGGDGACCMAVQAGFLYGTNSHGTICKTVGIDDSPEPCEHHDPYVCPFAQGASLKKRHRVAFIDNLYDKYDHAKHAAAVHRWQPKYATVRDLMTADQCQGDGIAFYPFEQIVAWADELSILAEHVILIPKYDCIDQIPARFTLGYSIPTSHGGTPVPIERFRGRRIHLLGGSWKSQLEHLAFFGDDVVSLDNNYVYKQAQLGSWCTPDGQGKGLDAAGIAQGAVTNPLAVCLALSLGSIGAKVRELAPVQPVQDTEEPERG